MWFALGIILWSEAYTEGALTPSSGGVGIEELEHATWHLKGSIMELKCSVTKALRRGGHPVTLQLKRFLCADEDSCTAPKRVKTGNDFLKHEGK